MTEPLSLQHFRALAAAYGGVIARWPVDVRAAAMAMANQPSAREILAEAEHLDAVLDSWTVASPSAELSERVLPIAPPAKATWHKAKLWWSGIGIAAALSGAVAGSLAVAEVAPSDPSSENITAFGDLGGQEGASDAI